MNTLSPTARPHPTWRKSSYSTSTGNCVEVAPTADGVAIRHSKHPVAGVITFLNNAWAAFVRDASEDSPTSANGVAAITKIGTDTLVRSLTADVELRFDEGEWSAFLAGADDGEFDFAPPTRHRLIKPGAGAIPPRSPDDGTRRRGGEKASIGSEVISGS